MFILKKSSAPAKPIPWYRKHAEAYIKANESASLSRHTGLDIDRYLNTKGRLSELKEWQFCQMADALRFLFDRFNSPPWSKTYDWFHWRAGIEFKPQGNTCHLYIIKAVI